MEDEKIIELYFCRNEEAVAETEKKYKTYCQSIAVNILHNCDDAEECVNSAWLGAWNSIPPEKPQNLKVYLAKITRNAAINKLKFKKAEKRGCEEENTVFDELSECIPAKENVEEEVMAKELENSINRFAKNLPQRERNVFIRRYFFMETTEEIGKRYSISANNAAVILHRVRKKLKKHLEKEGFV